MEVKSITEQKSLLETLAPGKRTRLHRLFDALPQRLVTITHDPTALEGADRVLWLDEGHLVADGPAAEILPLFRAEMARIGAADADTDLAH